MRIGILGAGNVGGAIGSAWARHGRPLAGFWRSWIWRARFCWIAPTRSNRISPAWRWAPRPPAASLWPAGPRRQSGKIFSTTGYANMANPSYGGQPITICYCGDDADAKRIAAAGLARDIGFDPIDAGPLANARLLEPYAMPWIWLAVKGGVGRDFAFKLVKRERSQTPSRDREGAVTACPWRSGSGRRWLRGPSARRPCRPRSATCRTTWCNTSCSDREGRGSCAESPP